MEPNNKTEEFVSLLTVNQPKIFSFIRSLVFNCSDAEDIMQDTSTIMWRKFDEYKPGTDFASWGVTIAKYRIFDYQKKKKNYALSRETLLLLSQKSEEVLSELDSRTLALEHCLKKLGDKEKNLLELKYSTNYTAKQIAHRVGISVNMVYRNMSRIKFLLLNCVNKQINMQSVRG